MNSLYIIRDKNTGAVCSSAKHCCFNMDINEASLFDSRANAEKAILKMLSQLSKEMVPYGGNTWTLAADGNTETFFHAFKEEYIALLESKPNLIAAAARLRNVKEVQVHLETVEVKLTIVG